MKGPPFVFFLKASKKSCQPIIVQIKIEIKGGKAKF